MKHVIHKEFQHFPDLANRALAGSVVYATDESFAERENLIMPHEPLFDPAEFGNKGKVYDGWETRRRRHEEIGDYDFAIVRLGIPGQIMGVVVDTAWFTGNFPPEVAVWGTCQDDLLTGRELAELPADQWFELVPRSPAQGDHQHLFEIPEGHPARRRRVTHVKLDMIPDGGIARLRVHGRPAPDPRFLAGTIDVAAMENGARVTECSNMFYSSPAQAIGLGRAVNMGGGWENARRRGEGNDHFTVELAAESTLRWVEVDTSYFVFNAPGDIRLTGITADGAEATLVPKTRVLPDTRHRFLIADAASTQRFTHVRLDVYPDGGLARLRVWGELTDKGAQDIAARW
ncbi:allantoicase [Corynebacterium heidelbergense]|uniref:Probable allantoicase n=1 Tax=Corynebacterium heidelbergense TaxID=2055947 RepID=A0A364V4H9_9CORY|nr:allantoicase [Corynebacterium heidelbergense]RAV31527.1 allantoicase [Corynebacterium heidelbergense]